MLEIDYESNEPYPVGPPTAEEIAADPEHFLTGPYDDAGFPIDDDSAEVA